MKLIKYNADTIDLRKLENTSYIGIMYLLNIESVNSSVSMHDFCKKYNISETEVEHVLAFANKLKLIEVEIENRANDIIYTINKPNENKKIDLVKMSLFLGIDIEQIKNVYDATIPKNDFPMFHTGIFNLARKKYEITGAPQIVINTKEDLYAFLQNSNVYEVIASRDCNLSNKEINYLIDLTSSKLSIPVLNCLVDFTIKSSIYNQFNVNFCKKVISSWEQNNIENVEDAVNLIKKQKEAISKVVPTYVEPTYEKYEEKTALSAEDAQEILDNVFG